jgi:tRNA pseudouridine55 synthase
MMEDHCDGIMLIDKDEDETSFDVVKRIRRRIGLKKVGHAGTLDPFATGLLIILLGQGTKLSPYLMAGEKRYLASLRLGIETDTLDPTGRVIRTKSVPTLDQKEVERKILEFVGEIEQSPPAFSAVNIKGQRSYKMARKGIKVELRKKRVVIRSIEIASIDISDITIEVQCSGGTYIRSLAADIGERLGTVAHVSSLRRLSSGPFHVKDAIKSKTIYVGVSQNNLVKKIISLKDSLPDMKTAHVDLHGARRIRNGYRPGWEELSDGTFSRDFFEGFIKIVSGKSLIAILGVSRFSSNDSDWLKSIRVFN